MRDLFSGSATRSGAKATREVRKPIDILNKEVIAEEAAQRRYHGSASSSSTTPSLATTAVTAKVIGNSPKLWYSTVTISNGASSGVRMGDQVVEGEGVVGKVALGPATAPRWS